jgi:nucleoside-diphosphate-sugar epimerase
VKVARLAQTFGEGVRPDDNRVYMQFARAAYEGRDIVLKTQGLSVGNYCAADDAVNAIFTILEKGADGETYNVVNEENTMCIRDMAQLVASEIAHGKIKVVVDTEDLGKTGYAADTALRMSGEKLRLLGWKPTKNLVQMYRDLVRELDKSHIF